MRKQSFIKTVKAHGARAGNRLRWNQRSFSDKARLRVLLLSEPARLPQSQIFPFYFYRRELIDRYNIELREISTATFERDPELAPSNADVVCVQTWFDLQKDRCDKLFSSIRASNPSSKIVFLDWYAPVDLRLAEILDPHVDLYVKKHVFRDRSRYFEPTQGDTNLTEYYGNLYGLNMKPTSFEIPEYFLNKLIVGPSFCTAPLMLSHFYANQFAPPHGATIDVHARLGKSGSEWYALMRQNALLSIQSIPDLHIITDPGVKQREYLNELRRSRLCFSPFGYGEVCWRDYEAVMCGAVLVKPDMSHIETYPDIFIPDKTYIPVEWNFSDVGAKVSILVKNRQRLASIANEAHSVLHDYTVHARFVEQVLPLFQG